MTLVRGSLARNHLQPYLLPPFYLQEVDRNEMSDQFQTLAELFFFSRVTSSSKVVS